jgi:hypothetical protein
MSMKTSVLTAMLLVLMVPSSSGADKKKHGSERGMLEKMEAVPCGAKERGLTGLGKHFRLSGSYGRRLE